MQEKQPIGVLCAEKPFAINNLVVLSPVGVYKYSR